MSAAENLEPTSPATDADDALAVDINFGLYATEELNAVVTAMHEAEVPAGKKPRASVIHTDEGLCVIDENFEQFVADELSKGDARMDAADVQRELMAKDITELRASVDVLHATLDKNTATTNAIKTDMGSLLSILASWQGAMKVLDWLGKVAKPVGYVATAIGSIWFLWRGGK